MTTRTASPEFILTLSGPQLVATYEQVLGREPKPRQPAPSMRKQIIAALQTAQPELPAAVVTAFSYGEVAVIEKFIEGVEVAVSVISSTDGEVALPAVEIRPGYPMCSSVDRAAPQTWLASCWVGATVP